MSLLASSLRSMGNINWEQLSSSSSSSSSSSIFLTTFAILTCLLLTTRLLIGRTASVSGRLPPPPGPWKLPIIGNLHQLISTTVPHRCLGDLARKHGPDVMQLQLGELSHIVVSSPSAAQQVMKTHDLIFASRPSLLAADMLLYAGDDLGFAPYTEKYKHLRKICVVELLSTARVRSFGPIRVEEVARLVHTVSPLAVVDVTKQVFRLSSRVTFRTALGKARELDDGFLNMVKVISDVMGGFQVADLFPSMKFLPMVSGLKPKLRRMHREMESLLDEIIDEHKERRAERSDQSTVDDLVDVLLNLQQSERLQFNLTMENIKAVTLEVFLASVETSAIVMDWTMAEMIKHERVLRKAQEEVRQVYRNKQNVDESSLHQVKYLDLVIKESLRLHPPLPLLVQRESRETVQLCGYEIPINTRVIINAWAIGRDSRYWNEPDKFYPERFLNSSIDYKGNDFEFIPFGAGRRMCPGTIYAISVVKLTLASLLYHFDWKLPDGMEAENLDMSEASGMCGRRKCSLCLIPIAYSAMA